IDLKTLRDYTSASVCNAALQAVMLEVGLDAYLIGATAEQLGDIAKNIQSLFLTVDFDSISSSSSKSRRPRGLTKRWRDLATLNHVEQAVAEPATHRHLEHTVVQVEKLIGYCIRNKNLLAQALRPENTERR
ncbi:hypothetical protein BGX34_008186, partial [Mortierella sp. NVP85]